jgi:hypothetical protein
VYRGGAVGGSGPGDLALQRHFLFAPAPAVRFPDFIAESPKARRGDQIQRGSRGPPSLNACSAKHSPGSAKIEVDHGSLDHRFSGRMIHFASCARKGGLCARDRVACQSWHGGCSGKAFGDSGAGEFTQVATLMPRAIGWGRAAARWGGRQILSRRPPLSSSDRRFMTISIKEE